MDHPYKNVLEDICTAVEEFRRGERSVQSLQNVLARGADVISSPEVRDDMEFLLKMEGQLEEALFCYFGEEREKHVKKIIVKIENRFCT
jgi:hypothetical protein